MTKVIRAVALGLHVIALLFGAYIAGAAVDSVLTNLNHDFLALMLSRVAVAACLIGVSAAYGALLFRRGFTALAPLAFAVSYVIVAVVVDGTTRGIAKNFAGADVDEIPMAYAMNIAVLIVAIGLSILAWVWIRRRSHFPLI